MLSFFIGPKTNDLLDMSGLINLELAFAFKIYQGFWRLSLRTEISRLCSVFRP